VSRADVQALRDDLGAGRVHPHSYRLRAVDGLQHGPFGHLVRDALLYPEAYDSVDYLAGSEIAVDVCHAMTDKFGFDFLSLYRSATVPCIVEFTSLPKQLDGVVASALWYIEAGQRGVHTTNANWCFDGVGNSVPPDRIISVTVRP
jgi:hypothetical protein